MDTYLAIASRREVRKYADRPIEEEVRRRILEAGRVAGSSQNKQRRRFICVESREALERLAQAVWSPANLAGAALVVAIATAGKGPLAFDAARAAQNMMLASWNEGVGSCPNGISDAEAAKQALGASEEESIAIILTFGYPARPSDPAKRTPEEWIERANRKPFDEVVETI
jgi:nitroreductase